MDQKSKVMGEATGSAKALAKGIALVDLLVGSPRGLRLTDIVHHAQLPKSTVLRLIETLLDADMIREVDGVYRLGPRCAVWGSAFLDGLELRSLARDLLERLVSISSETAHLGVLDGTRILYIDKMDSPHSLRMFSRVGLTSPLYCTGLGKALLAFAGDSLLEKVIAEGLARRTENTITDGDALRAEMARIRRSGYSVDDVENEDGVRCTGAPVFDHHGRLAAALSIAGPMHRMTRERLGDLAPKVAEAGLELSRRLGFSGQAGH
jgi:IclR family acetate operon transcriptional repressor